LSFILRRCGLALVTIVLVSVLCFLSLGVMKGDPASLMLGTEGTPEQLAALREELGLNGSVPQRYFRWLLDFCRGNPGNSIRFPGQPVAAMLKERLPVTAALALLSLGFILLIAVPMSLFTVRREGGPLDRTVNALTAFGVSIPGFFLGVIFIWIFGITFRLFIPGIYVDYRESFSGFLACLFFPALAIAIPNAAVLVKFLRSFLFREMGSAYVRSAMGKGASFSYALRRHALPNALVPLLSVLALIIADVFSGSIIIEQVFTMPGIGRLFIAAIMSRDYPVIQSLALYIACIVIAANALVDIAIQIIDPRIRLEKSSLRGEHG